MYLSTIWKYFWKIFFATHRCDTLVNLFPLWFIFVMEFHLVFLLMVEKDLIFPLSIFLMICKREMLYQNENFVQLIFILCKKLFVNLTSAATKLNLIELRGFSMRFHMNIWHKSVLISLKTSVLRTIKRSFNFFWQHLENTTNDEWCLCCHVITSTFVDDHNDEECLNLNFQIMHSLIYAH